MGHSALYHLPFGCIIFFFFNDSWRQCPLRSWLGARLNHLSGCLPLPGIPSLPYVLGVQWCIFLPDMGHVPKGSGPLRSLSSWAPQELGAGWMGPGRDRLQSGWPAEGAWLPSLPLRSPGVGVLLPGQCWPPAPPVGPMV